MSIKKHHTDIITADIITANNEYNRKKGHHQVRYHKYKVSTSVKTLFLCYYDT